MAALSVRKLDSVSMHFPSENDHFVNRSNVERYGELIASFGDLHSQLAFSGLRRLSLTYLSGNIQAWREKILQVLLNSPDLEHLSLSISPLASASANPDDFGGDWAYASWKIKSSLFQWLCDQYFTTSRKRLKLRSVHIGFGIQLPDFPALEKSFDPSELEQVHVYNIADTSGTPWALLAPENSPKLRNISIDEVNEDWRYMLLEDSHPRMEKIESLRIHRCFLLDVLRGTSSIFDTLADERAPKIPAVMGPLAESRTTGDISVLEGATWITAIALEISVALGNGDRADVFEIALEAVREVLAAIGSLRHLWISVRGVAADVPLTEVKRLARDCVHLRYVRINRQAWRIHRKGKRGGFIEAMDEWEDEVEGPECFHVPAPLPWCERMDHVDWDRGGY